MATVLSLIVAIAAWQWPRSPQPEADGSGTTQPTSATTATTDSSTPTGTQQATGRTTSPTQYLNSIQPEAGSANLVELPRAIRNKADYTAHPIAIRCSSNQISDDLPRVTWPLRGRYAEVRAVVRPYYPEGTDTASATYVTATVGRPQPDRTPTISAAGELKTAMMDRPETLVAEVEGADTLTVRIQCGNPSGTIVLTDAVLIPA